jgi:hypothetical protein
MQARMLKHGLGLRSGCIGRRVAMVLNRRVGCLPAQFVDRPSFVNTEPLLQGYDTLHAASM